MSSASFLLGQLRQIRAGGGATLCRKAWRLLQLLREMTMKLAALPIVALIRLIRPFVVVRFMGVDVGRIGGTYYAEFYLSHCASGRYRGPYLDLFYFVRSTDHVNHQWYQMWQRTLPTIPFRDLTQVVDGLNRRVEGYRSHLIPCEPVIATRAEHLAHASGNRPEAMERYNAPLMSVLESGGPHLWFRSDEEARGDRALRALGIPAGNPFICFHARDSVFLDAVVPEHDWQYHDYRDSSIHNYVLAAEEMAERGIFAVRTGAKVQDTIDSDSPLVIDYATNGSRSDFLDVYLAGKCRFYLCSDTGISFPAEVFRRPVAYVNWTLLHRIPVYTAKGLLVFKKFYLRDEGRYMNFSEMLALEFGGQDTSDILTERKIDLIENTAEEILAATIEMDDRLAGVWETSKEDEDLQSRFWALFGQSKLKSPELRVGAQFLRENQELL